MLYGRATCQRGFSLLEVLVAFSIMALSLGALYQAAGGSVRGAIEAERQSRAVLLARSILDQHANVARGGVRDDGVYDDLRWSLVSEPWPVAGDPPPPVLMQRLLVEVSWVDRGRGNRLSLATLVPELPEMPETQ